MMEPDFAKNGGLIPCIVQDAQTLRVLMLGYMNDEAFRKTISEKRVTFFSRSKQRLWTKGETSGNFIDVVSYTIDCDSDTILVKGTPHGPVCHTGEDTCFREKNTIPFTIAQLERIVEGRKKNPKPNSYTNKLLDGGINKMAQKVGEEAVELVIEAKDNNKPLFLNEAADLLYHLLVLMVAKGVALADVEKVLAERHIQN